MSSKRDKLLKANAANAATRGNTSTNETIFGDFINRDNKKEIVRSEIEEIIPVKEEKIENKNPENDIELKSKRIINEAETKDGPVKDIENVIPEKDINIPEGNKVISNEINAETDSNSDNLNEIKSTGRNKSLTVCMPEDIYTFLYKKAISEGMSCTAFLQKILKDEMYLGEYVEDELMIRCRKRQHDVFTKTFIYDEVFVDAVKVKAREYYMKPTNFVRYCIEKIKVQEVKA